MVHSIADGALALIAPWLILAVLIAFAVMCSSRALVDIDTMTVVLIGFIPGGATQTAHALVRANGVDALTVTTTYAAIVGTFVDIGTFSEAVSPHSHGTVKSLAASICEKSCASRTGFPNTSKRALGVSADKSWSAVVEPHRTLIVIFTLSSDTVDSVASSATRYSDTGERTRYVVTAKPNLAVVSPVLALVHVFASAIFSLVSIFAGAVITTVIVIAVLILRTPQTVIALVDISTGVRYNVMFQTRSTPSVEIILPLVIFVGVGTNWYFL